MKLIRLPYNTSICTVHLVKYDSSLIIDNEVPIQDSAQCKIS